MEAQAKKKVSVRARIQAFGGFLTNMVLPNIGAFIAWGIVTALFIPSGWMPNKALDALVTPMITYLLPLLLAYTGGKMIGGHRGGVLGAIGTMGLIIGANIPMFLGAMLVGPLGGWVMKKTDKALDGRIPAGFEMIVNNFSIGIIGFILVILSFKFIGPAIVVANNFVKMIIQAIVRSGFLPAVAIINEPAKVLFLNNVIDQGIYYPLGMQQTLAQGKSIYFMLASNPGPGLGLLLAYTFFGKGAAKRTAPGAAIIHFFGGIHEMYFPYVLMKPITLIGMIAGAMSGILTAEAFHAGLVAGPSPGSIFAYLALTPKGNFVGVIADVTIACAVSFVVNSFLLRIDKSEPDDDAFAGSVAMSNEMQQAGKEVLSSATGADAASADSSIKIVAPADYKKISYACDAGMGSSAMGATTFRNKLKKAGITDIEVKNYRIEDVPADSDLVVVHKDLSERMAKARPNMQIISLDNYLADPKVEALVQQIIDARGTNKAE